MSTLPTTTIESLLPRQVPVEPTPDPWLGRLARSRLAQFIVLGSAIFAASRLRADNDIALTRAQLTALQKAEAQRTRSAASDPDLAHDVVNRAVEDEILYREGIALGFDKNDAIVRQRVVQKTLFLAEELAGASEPPTDAELRAFFEATRLEWKRPPRVQFTHVFSRDRAALVALAPRIGEPSPIPSSATLTEAELTRALGADFARAVMGADVGAVAEPLRSTAGFHRVRIIAKEPAREPSFEEVKDELRGPCSVKRRQDAIAGFLARAGAKYRIVVDGKNAPELQPTGRIARRSPASAED